MAEGRAIAALLIQVAVFSGVSGQGAVSLRPVGNAASDRSGDQAASKTTSISHPASAPKPSSSRKNWPLVHIPDPVARQATIQALEAASGRLARDECRRILIDFPEQGGRRLSDVLVALSVDLRTYPTMLVFMDDSRHRRCVSGVLAFTAPGSRVVRVCVDELKRTWTESPEYTIAALIHEILHTLGLGENPPSPAAITARVMSRCRPSGK